MDRESFIIPEDEIDDYTGIGPWKFKNEIYNFIEDYPGIDCDGECHNIIVQRESDLKYFHFTWMLTRSENYHYEGHWVEVKSKIITSIIWIWDE